jgi:hypothetical protein
MEEKAIRIEGTKYVKIGDSIFNTAPKDPNTPRVICECVFCGERFGANAAGQCAVYCKNCKILESRKKITEENNKIKQENVHT